MVTRSGGHQAWNSPTHCCITMKNERFQECDVSKEEKVNVCNMWTNPEWELWVKNEKRSSDKRVWSYKGKPVICLPREEVKNLFSFSWLESMNLLWDRRSRMLVLSCFYLVFFCPCGWSSGWPEMQWPEWSCPIPSRQPRFHRFFGGEAPTATERQPKTWSIISLCWSTLLLSHI